MSNPAFIVDGFTELRIVQRICPGRPIQRTDLNGNCVTLEAIANKICSRIRLMGNRYYPIIILVDREQREISFDTMATELLRLIHEQGLADQDIRIGIADRMIENWIIADWETFCNNSHPKPEQTDDCNGTSIIKKVKGTYDKRAEGVELFAANRQTTMYQNSPSFRHFINTIEGVNCDYINFEK